MISVAFDVSLINKSNLPYMHHPSLYLRADKGTPGQSIHNTFISLCTNSFLYEYEFETYLPTLTEVRSVERSCISFLSFQICVYIYDRRVTQQASS